MRTLQIALWILILPLLASGCRTNPNQVLLERESRLLEDKVHHLESLLDDSHAAREATIRENESLKKELAGGDRGAGPAVREPRENYQAPSIELPSGEGEPPRRSRRQKAPKLEPPTIELPEPSDTPAVEMPPGDENAAAEGPPTQLVINQQLTGGLDRDGQRGDEGILVVVEPRDAEGHWVQTSGAVSVVVMDPALEGDATRVARWNFDHHEVTSHFRNTVFGRGLQFELPWPAEPPQNRNLRLFVRFTTEDGRKLTSDVPLEVRTPSDPPGEDRQTKSRSATESAGQPPRSRTPHSRLNSPRAGSHSPSGLSPSDTDEAGDSPRRSDLGTGQPPRQATRPDRSLWKPYR